MATMRDSGIVEASPESRRAHLHVARDGAGREKAEGDVRAVSRGERGSPPKSRAAAIILCAAGPAVTSDMHFFKLTPFDMTVQHSEITPCRQRSLEMRAQMMFEVTACINIAVMVTTGVFLVLITLRRAGEDGVCHQHALGVGTRHYRDRTEL